MPSYEVSTTKPQAGRINSFLDAKNEAEAIEAFRRNFRLDAYEKKRGVTLVIAVSKIAGKDEEETTADKPVAKIMAELRADKAAAAKEAKEAAKAVVEPPAAKGPLDDLKRFGVSDEQIAALLAAGLTTPDAIVMYARAHNGLGSIGGITPADAGRIATAVKAAKAN